MHGNFSYVFILFHTKFNIPMYARGFNQVQWKEYTVFVKYK